MLALFLAGCSPHVIANGPGKVPDDSAAVDSVDSGLDCTDVTTTNAVLDAFASAATECDYQVLSDWAITRRGEFASPYNEYIQLSESTDQGDSFSLVADKLLIHAGVPEIVVSDDGIWHLFYVDGDFDEMLTHVQANDGYFDTHGWQGPGGFAEATSSDGLTFTKNPDFMIDGIAQAMVVDPDIIRLSDGSYRMYYVGISVVDELEGDTWVADTEHDLYYATSDDLTHWTSNPDPILTGPYADPTVICLTDTDCILYSFGMDEATSTDGGLTWDFQNLDAPPAFGPEFVKAEDGSTLVYFNTMEPGAAVRIMQSFDGNIWNYKNYDVMPDTYGEAPTIHTDFSGTWYMYTHAYVGGEPGDSGG